MSLPPSIYDFVKEEENRFETDEIQVAENWHWNFRKHVQLIFHLKNGIFYTGENNWLRAFKNIMEPIIALANWTEDIEVKDTTFFIEGEDDRALSFLVKKYHDEVYVREHDLDTWYDEITENDNTYGGYLVQRGKKRPETLKLKHVAFCDQTNILGGPIGFKHYFAPEKLREMSKFGWGDKKNGATISLEDLITLASDMKDSVGSLSSGKQNKVPGKAVEVYIVRGNLPEHYLEDNDEMEYFCYQLQIVALYTDKDNKKQGVTLYRKKEDDGNIKFFTSQEVEDRALGRGVGEALLHPQVWTNFLTIHKMNMLEAAAKVPVWTDDDTFTQQNLRELDTQEVVKLAEGRQLGLVPTVSGLNVQVLDNAVNEWYQHGQFTGAAFDTLMGKEESSGTTFRGQERLVQQGRGPHDRKRGKRAKFIEEVYRDWIIPDMMKEITKGHKFLATLSVDELTWVAEQMSTNLSNKRIKEIVLNMKPGEATPERIQSLKEMREVLRGEILKKGSKQLHEIIKDEAKDVAIRMGINIAGKQKNLNGLSDKVLSIFQFAMANPVPTHLIKPFNDILEYGGISPVDFQSFVTQNQQMLQAQAMGAGVEMQPQAPQLAVSSEVAV